jgi:hypothetical protein
MRPRFCVTFTLFENRGRRESRAPIAPAVVRTMSARVDHGSTGSFRLSPREWVTAYSVLSPVTGLFATVALRMTDAPQPGRVKRISATLDASIGAPGPHDFTVRDRLHRALRRPRAARRSSVEDRLQRRSSARRLIAHGKPALRSHCAPDAVASIASHRAFVTTRETPLARVRRAERNH